MCSERLIYKKRSMVGKRKKNITSRIDSVFVNWDSCSVLNTNMKYSYITYRKKENIGYVEYNLSKYVLAKANTNKFSQDRWQV